MPEQTAIAEMTAEEAERALLKGLQGVERLKALWIASDVDSMSDERAMTIVATLIEADNDVAQLEDRVRLLRGYPLPA